MEPILGTFWINFGALLEPILELKSAPEGNQKWDHFWDPLAPALRGPQPAFPGILREVWKGYWNWNYTLQKKGRDCLYNYPPLVKSRSHFFFFGGQGHPGKARGPRGKPGKVYPGLPGGPLACPWVPLALPWCPWPPWSSIKLP